MLPVRVGIRPAPGDIPSVHRDSLENGDYVVATGKGGALFLQEFVSEGVVSRQVSPNDDLDHRRDITTPWHPRCANQVTSIAGHRSEM